MIVSRRVDRIDKMSEKERDKHVEMQKLSKVFGTRLDCRNVWDYFNLKFVNLYLGMLPYEPD